MKLLILKLFAFIKKILTVFLKILPDKESVRYKKDFISVYERYAEEQSNLCYLEFKKYFKNAVFLHGYPKIINFSLDEAQKINSKNEKLNLEFGVFKGQTANLISKKIKKLYAFDSFEGLRDIWYGGLKSQSDFDLKGKIPKLNKNVFPIKGYVQDTLKNFIDENLTTNKIAFVHMDLDTYESTKFVLDKIKPFLVNGSIILFGQIYNYPGWEYGEYKALKEVFNDKEFNFIAFSENSKYGVIKIIN